MTGKRRKIIALMVVIITIAGCLAFLYIGHYGKQSDKNTGSSSQDIKIYHSNVDKDGDGIDDQTDILQSTKDYIATRPKYKSKYYQGGYPDDGYGVCTDVVAAALKGAGYDLRDLVNEDIQEHPENYDIASPDPNIDYRRVKNLKVWFANNTISCTLDLKDVNAWQGGDIVIFKNHIGMVSDRRNKDGVPYVIHHYSSRQKNYEQDILEKRDDIAGHYRMS